MTKQWDLYRDEIIALYQEFTLETVQRMMKEKHGFEASIRSYKMWLCKWNVHKYNRHERRGRRANAPEAAPEAAAPEAAAPEAAAPEAAAPELDAPEEPRAPEPQGAWPCRPQLQAALLPDGPDPNLVDAFLGTHAAICRDRQPRPSPICGCLGVPMIAQGVVYGVYFDHVVTCMCFGVAASY